MFVVSIGTHFETHARHMGSFSQGFRVNIKKKVESTTYLFLLLHVGVLPVLATPEKVANLGEMFVDLPQKFQNTHSWNLAQIPFQKKSPNISKIPNMKGFP